MLLEYLNSNFTCDIYFKQGRREKVDTLGLSLVNKLEAMKKSNAWIKPKGRVDWGNFREQPLKIEAPWYNLA